MKSTAVLFLVAFLFGATIAQQYAYAYVPAQYGRVYAQDLEVRATPYDPLGGLGSFESSLNKIQGGLHPRRQDPIANHFKVNVDGTGDTLNIINDL